MIPLFQVTSDPLHENLLETLDEIPSTPPPPYTSPQSSERGGVRVAPVENGGELERIEVAEESEGSRPGLREADGDANSERGQRTTRPGRTSSKRERRRKRILEMRDGGFKEAATEMGPVVEDDGQEGHIANSVGLDPPTTENSDWIEIPESYPEIAYSTNCPVQTRQVRSNETTTQANERLEVERGEGPQGRGGNGGGESIDRFNEELPARIEIEQTRDGILATSEKLVTTPEISPDKIENRRRSPRSREEENGKEKVERIDRSANRTKSGQRPKFPWLLGRNKSIALKPQQQQQQKLKRTKEGGKKVTGSDKKIFAVFAKSETKEKRKKKDRKDIRVFRTDTISTLNSLRDDDDEDDDIEGRREDKGCGESRSAGEAGNECLDDVTYERSTVTHRDIALRRNRSSHARCKTGTKMGRGDGGKSSGPLSAAPPSNTADELKQIIEENRAKSKERKKIRTTKANGEASLSVRRRPLIDGDDRVRNHREKVGNDFATSRGRPRGESTRKNRSFVEQGEAVALEEGNRRVEEWDEGPYLSPSEARKKRKQSSIKIERRRRKTTKI